MKKTRASSRGRALAPTPVWILVLASQAPLRELLLWVLGLTGYTALGSATLRQAESLLLARGQPALIVLDDAGTTETALAQQVHQVAAHLSPAVVPDPGLVSRASPAARSLPGQALVVGKPFDLAEVLGLIASQTTPQSAEGPLNRLSVAPQTRGAARNGELLRDGEAEDRPGRRPCWPARPSPISWRPSPAPDTGGAP